MLPDKRDFLNDTISNTLYLHRVTNRYSQAEVGASLGLNTIASQRNIVFFLEHGARYGKVTRLSLTQMFSLCELFHITVADFFKGCDISPLFFALPEEEYALVENFRGLNADGTAKVLSFIRDMSGIPKYCGNEAEPLSLPDALGRNIAAFRKKTKVGQQKIGKVLGCNTDHGCQNLTFQIEKGSAGTAAKTFSIENALDLCDYFDLRLMDLIDGYKLPVELTSRTEDEIQLLESFRMLNQAGKLRTNEYCMDLSEHPLYSK